MKISIKREQNGACISSAEREKFGAKLKTTKFFMMAALALTFAACSNDNDMQTPAGQPAKAEGITITATLAPKDASATTRKVSEGTGAAANTIVASWAVNEHIAILYNKDGAQAADATITAVDGTTGAATISFTVKSGTTDNTACTLVYPASAAKDDHTGVKDAATLLAAQDGTLSANLDVRVGAGTIQTTTPSLTVSTQPEAQFAIFKFTVKNSDASATIDVKPLTVTIGSQNYVITPSSATNTLYAALPAVSSQTVSFSATGSDSKTYTYSKDGVSFAAGYYYQSTLKMAAATPLTLTSPAVGQVIGSDGKNYTAGANLPSGVTKVAMIAYVSGSNGLAIALADEGAMYWATAVTTAAGHTPAFNGGTWKLPSQAEWKQMFKANGGNEGKYNGLNTALAAAGGDSSKLQEDYYWSSSSTSDGRGYCVKPGSGGNADWYADNKNSDYLVRACLAF